jgi:O-6-methylguanine DNA methyltransferase
MTPYALTTPLGPLTITLSQSGIQTVSFHQKLVDSQGVPTWAQAWLSKISAYIIGTGPWPTLPLDVHVGTPFQHKVWTHLQTIPAGQVQTYSDVAYQIGHPNAVRAVASACAKNPIAILIPCHRVIGKNGQLTGYYWGLDRKKALLELEKNGY